ncbi:MoaD/ThiS family protein [Salipiger sp. P9]|uniref:MoaD/ThiS family protein n=1 Tax=Salipiger pentaromativorans TaxID=2943193 RepID=UPI0021582845|nr:MoaD/ThiS family protein [Salipiger pentaromativorans]MCR8550629.1 MoaD/ThiS family protein [Salipiger pentaromativorans]
MVAVNLWSSLTRFTDGARVVELEAATAGQVLDGLKAAYPGLAPIVDAGVSVVIDGEMATGRHSPIGPESEVVLMQRLKGG